MFERCLYFNINTLTRQINKIWDHAFQELGLSPAHAYLLRLVLAQPGISQKGIADELRLEKSTVTRFIDALESNGYLQRNKMGREQIILPTSAAKKIEKDLNQRGDQLYKEMTKNIGKDKLVKLVAQLRETSNILK